MTNHGFDQIVQDTPPNSAQRSAALTYRYACDLYVGGMHMDRAVGSLMHQRDLPYESEVHSAVTMLWADAWHELVRLIGQEASVRVHRAIAKDVRDLPKKPPGS